MRFIKFLLITVLFLGLIIVFNTNQPFGSPLPPVGKLLNPFTGFWQNAEGDITPNKLDLKSESLKETVEVYFDQRLVPHFFAKNNEDVAYAQGYVHAMYRLWQMDIATRAVSGRLSEVLGERTLSRDKLQKKKGFTYAAENELQAWMSNSEEKALLEAYARGVNDYVDQLKVKDYPIEFKILDYKPEKWSPMKSALFIKNMAESLCFRHADLQASNAKEHFGEELFEFLYPEQNPKQSPIIPMDTPFDFEPEQPFEGPSEEKLLGLIRIPELLELPPENNGSNNWAISAAKSASGNPILCSDPHLGLTLPSIWYESHINTPTINSYGVSLPSEPGILIGFNDHIAWAETNVGHDVLDWYQISWVDEAKTKYLLDGKEQAVSVRKDTVWVKGHKKPHIVETKYTVWGPIVYEDTTSHYYDLAMRWIAHDQPESQEFGSMGTFWNLMASKNYNEYRKALTGYDSPAQNFAFASTEGDIAITVNGKFPIKRDQQGRFVQDGSKSSNGWNGFIPRDQIPSVKNPDRGFIASANQHSTSEEYPYYYNGGFDDYRGRAVNARLDTMEKVSIDEMMEMQTSSFGLYAKDFMELIIPLIDQSQLSKEETQALSLLKSWDLYYTKEAKAPVLLDILDDSIYNKTFDEVFSLAEQDIPMLYPENWRLLEIISQNPEHPIFDNQNTDEKETALSIINQSFKEAVADWSKEQTSWLERNQPAVNHMANLDPFSRKQVATNGNGLTINAVRGNHGPSWRMIVEMDKEQVKAYGVYPGGQSGNPGSRFYDHMVDQWAKGEYNKLIFPKTKEAFKTEDLAFKLTFNKK